LRILIKEAQIDGENGLFFEIMVEDIMFVDFDQGSLMDEKIGYFLKDYNA